MVKLFSSVDHGRVQIQCGAADVTAVWNPAEVVEIGLGMSGLRPGENDLAAVRARETRMVTRMLFLLQNQRHCRTT